MHRLCKIKFDLNGNKLWLKKTSRLPSRTKCRKVNLQIIIPLGSADLTFIVAYQNEILGHMQVDYMETRDTVRPEVIQEDDVERVAKFFYMRGGLCQRRDAAKANFQSSDFELLFSEFLRQYCPLLEAMFEAHPTATLARFINSSRSKIAARLWDLIETANDEEYQVEDEFESVALQDALGMLIDMDVSTQPGIRIRQAIQYVVESGLAKLASDIYSIMAWESDSKTVVRDTYLAHVGNILAEASEPRHEPLACPHNSFREDDRRSGSRNTKRCLVLRWEVPQLVRRLKSRMEGHKRDSSQWPQQLREHLVITGRSHIYRTDAVSAFIKSSWTDLGENLFEAIIKALSEHQETSREDPLRNSTSVTQRFGDSQGYNGIVILLEHHIIVSLNTGPLWKHNAVSQVLCWLCKAIRVAPIQRGNLFRSSVSMTAAIRVGEVEDGMLLLNILPLVTLESDREPCWISLFSGGIVVDHSVQRNWGRGLEIAFDAMVQLAAIESSVHINCNQESDEDDCQNLCYPVKTGEILTGFFTALVPIEENEEKDSVQWHFEFNEVDIIDPSSLNSIKGNWLQLQDITLLRDRRSFVGWCKEANVMLGTRNLPINLLWTGGLATRKRTLHRKGYSAEIQATLQGGVAQVTGIGGASFDYVSNTQRFKPNDNYAKAMTIMSKQVALIYDRKAGRAWLVPKLSLLLHMSHAYFKYFFNSDTTSEDPIPFAMPSSDGAKAALEALINRGDTVLSRYGDSQSDIQNLRQVLLDLNYHLIDANRTREKSTSRHILGSELMNLVTESEVNNDLKIVKAPAGTQAWTCIANKADAILICEDIDLAVQRVTSCHNTKCCDVPLNQGYLTAHMWCLQKILEKDGSEIEDLRSSVVKIGQGHTWRLVGTPFESCSHGPQNSCWDERRKLLQEVMADTLTHRMLRMRSIPEQYSCQLPINGAVIFGRTSQEVQQSKGLLSWPAI